LVSLFLEICSDLISLLKNHFYISLKKTGPGLPLDTDKYFIICTNVIGGCYGSTGPSSIDPTTGSRYATRFPILSIWDMLRAQFKLLDYLGIQKLNTAIGASMGGMQVLYFLHSLFFFLIILET